MDFCTCLPSYKSPPSRPPISKLIISEPKPIFLPAAATAGTKPIIKMTTTAIHSAPHTLYNNTHKGYSSFGGGGISSGETTNINNIDNTTYYAGNPGDGYGNGNGDGDGDSRRDNKYDGGGGDNSYDGGDGDYDRGGGDSGGDGGGD